MSTYLSYVIGIGFSALLVGTIIQLWRYTSREADRRLRADAVNGFMSSLHTNLKSSTVAEQAHVLGIVHRRLVMRFPEISASLMDLVEVYVYRYETLSPEAFKDRYGVDKDAKIRDRALELLAFLRKRAPFASVSTRPAGLLRTLQQAVDAANQDLAAATLVQLAEEFEQIEERGRTQIEKARRSYVLSVVGLLLTGTFGLISLLQFIYPLLHRQTSR